MPDAGTLVVAAGRQGFQGPQGPSPGEPLANVNGRQNAAWVPVLPLSGGTLSNGLNMQGNAVYVYQGAYGYCFYSASSALWLLSDQTFDFYSGGGFAQRFRTSELWFSQDGWRIVAGSTGDLIYYDWASNPLMGLSVGMNQMVVWSNLQCTGAYSIGTANGALWGIVYANISGNGFRFRWDGTYVNGIVNNSAVIPLASACDERLKDDIAPASYDCLAALRKIRLYEYRWRDHQIPGRPRYVPSDFPLMPVGFVAQRLDEDYPGSVMIPLIEKTDQGVGLQNADANIMMALLVGAVQELDNAITAKERAAAD